MSFLPAIGDQIVFIDNNSENGTGINNIAYRFKCSTAAINGTNLGVFKDNDGAGNTYTYNNESTTTDGNEDTYQFEDSGNAKAISITYNTITNKIVTAAFVTNIFSSPDATFYSGVYYEINHNNIVTTSSTIGGDPREDGSAWNISDTFGESGYTYYRGVSGVYTVGLIYVFSGLIGTSPVTTIGTPETHNGSTNIVPLPGFGAPFPSYYYSVNNTILINDVSYQYGLLDTKPEITVSGNVYSLTRVMLGSSIYEIENLGPESVPCLTETCNILTPNGYQNVSSLKEGDIITTSDNRNIAIEKIFTSETKTSHMMPCVIKAHQYGLNQPIIDTHLSDFHAYNIKGQWKLPKNEKLLKEWHNGNNIMYYHIKLPDYSKDHLVVNGLITECWDGHLPKEMHLHYWKKTKYGVILQSKHK